MEFGFGHVQILFGVLGVLLLHGELRFGDVCPHALLGGDDVAAKAVTGGGLLFLEIIERLRDGPGAAVDVVVAVFVFFDLRGFFGLGLGGGIGGLGVLFGLAGRRLLRRLRWIASRVGRC